MFATCKIHVLPEDARVTKLMFWRIQIYIDHILPTELKGHLLQSALLKAKYKPTKKKYIVSLHENVTRWAEYDLFIFVVTDLITKEWIYII